MTIRKMTAARTQSTGFDDEASASPRSRLRDIRQERGLALAVLTWVTPPQGGDGGGKGDDMARFSIETIDDRATGHVAAEIRSEPDGAIVARSGPVFASHDDAREHLLDAISKAWPSQPVDPVYPANGS